MAAVAVKKKPVAGARKGKGHLRPTQEKRDDDIIHTNDSSIVSKRSVSKLYFPNEPDFYEPVTAKFVRRNPLINRGYWLRMHAIEQVVLRFLNDNPQKPKLVVNLGCGYDPLPFQFWHRHEASCHNATFVDVDYPQLIEKKRDRMLRDGLLRVPLLKTNPRSSTPPVYLRSDRYAAIGCDLKQLDTLENVLKTEFDLSSSSILFVAEVSVTYMPAADANALVAWAGKFENSHFCLLEQFLPQGPDHPFASTMLKHFNKLHTTIHAVKDYPSLALQKSRFTDSGWKQATIRNLWDLWSDDRFTPSSLRRSLDAIEPFDEWEEYALFAGHYFVLAASNSSSRYLEEATPQSDQAPAVKDVSSLSIVLTSHVPSSETRLSPRRFGAAFALNEHTLAVHGGQGVQHRLTSIEVLGRTDLTVGMEPSSTPQARICHTITTLDDGSVLLVGGRTSPSHALSDCRYLTYGAWRTVDELLPGRFRHAAVRVSIPCPESEVPGVLVFGGKTSDGHVLDDCNVWTANHGWQNIPVSGPRPTARFGAAICSLGPNRSDGIIMGGMALNGTVLGDVWQYSISATPELRIEFKDRSQDVRPSAAGLAYARFGASLTCFGDSLLLVGGIASKEILGLSDEFLAVLVGETIRFEKPDISLPKPTWPLLIGAGVSAGSGNEIVIVGGGAVCFSMGSFWNEGYLTISKPEAPQSTPRSVSVIQSAEEPKAPEKTPTKPAKKNKSKGKPKKKDGPKQKTTTVPRVTLHSPDDFTWLLASSKPVIIQGLDLGPCTALWTLDYLKDKLGADREIVIHECASSRMTFKDKNFAYIKKSVGDFLDGIAQGAQTYLRAVSAAQPNKLPTKLEEDFPAIAGDFKVPEILSVVKDTYHSSPLRISGPVSLWLHYDVLANILCQIRGTKTLRLYPPSDVKYLDYPPGGSSSNTNVLESQDARLHPHIAFLKPGDVLFIPPMWSHAATPEDGYSVAVNIFFRNLDKGYAAGKDVYGNRDLQAYENGRRDVEKIARAFRDIPGDITGFYVERLAAELLERAEGMKKGTKVDS